MADGCRSRGMVRACDPGSPDRQRRGWCGAAGGRARGRRLALALAVGLLCLGCAPPEPTVHAAAEAASDEAPASGVRVSGGGMDAEKQRTEEPAPAAASRREPRRAVDPCAPCPTGEAACPERPPEVLCRTGKSRGVGPHGAGGGPND